MQDLQLVVDGFYNSEDQSAATTALGRVCARYRAMVEHTVDVIVVYDRDGIRTYVSPVAQELLGYSPETMVNKKGYSTVHPDDHAKTIAVFRSIGPDHLKDQTEFRMRRSDGVYIWVEQSFRYIPEDDSVLTVTRDIDARKAVEIQLAETRIALELANQRLRIEACEDGLTKLTNRRCFDEILDKEFYRARREQQALALIMIDVDCFKSYNDAYGHVAGDECLRQVSAAVKTALVRPGDQAARYGGEELAVILPVTDQVGSLCVAERIRQAVAALQIAHIGNPNGYVTISAGIHVETPPFDASTPVDMVSAADRALYQAKSEGRNCIRVSAGRNTI